MTLELKMEELYRVPPEKVFRAWTEVALLEQWFGCGPGQLWKIHTWDCRKGGKLKVSMDFDGTPYVVEGEFLEVTTPRRLTYMFGQERVDVRFEDHPEGTLVKLTHHDIPDEQNVEIRRGGWSYCLGPSLHGHVEAPMPTQGEAAR